MGLQCGICFEPFHEPVSVPCGHVFCAGCLSKTFEEHDGYDVPCPSCRVLFPTVSLDLHMVPRKFRDHVTPCIRRLYLDDTSDASQIEAIRAQAETTISSLESQLEEERRKSADLLQERDAAKNERDSLYRVINVYKAKEKEHETKDRRQKFQAANHVDELLHDNQRLQNRLEEAQTLLATMGLDRRTPPPSVSRPAPSTPRNSSVASRPSIFGTPVTPRSFNISQVPISPLRAGLAVAREDLQARMRIYSPTKLKLGEKRMREPQDDIDMAVASSEGEKDDTDETITAGGSRRVQRPSGVQGRSVRRKYGLLNGA